MAQQTLNTPRETTHQRIAAALEAIEQNMSDEHEAVNIDYDNTYSGLSADNVQEAIDELVNEKADKSTTLAGYGITDAYTKTETDTLLDGKVDKITGKGLSTEDYTTTDKTKLAGIEAQANKTVVDSAMSDSSTNPLQNKVITKELEGAKTATGNPITVTDAAPVNAVNLSMDLEPIQAGSGTPSPENIRPISGRSEVEIYRVGKNLLPNITGARETDSIYIGQTDSTEYPIHLIANQPYTIQFITNVPATAYFKTATSGTVLFGLNGATYTPTETIDVQIWVYGNGVTEAKDFQLELGSTATPYEPYAGKTYTIQIGQDVYGGTLDVLNGVLTVEKAYVDLGTLNWTLSDGFFRTNDLISTVKKPINNQTMVNAISSVYPIMTWAAINTTDTAIAVSVTGQMIVANPNITNVSDFVTAVTGQTLVYELATPFTIDLTPSQIKMLENTNTLSSDGTMTLEYQPNNAIGEAVRAVEESYDPEFAVRPVLKKKAFSGTTDSDGSVTLINASDIPSNHRIIPLHITDMTIGGSAGTYFVEYEPYNSGDAVKGYCYFYMSGSQMFPVGKAITGNFYYYELEV